MSLPVDQVLPELGRALDETGAAVLVAPPGSGKTTRVPPFLDEHLSGEGKILVLEPRRVAARMAAEFLAGARGERVGQSVGYQVRHERRIGPETRVVVLTEGLLTAKLQADPFLEGVRAVVLDEFHERSLHADLGLALLREIRREARPDLKIVVMSATIDPERIVEYLQPARVVKAEGRSFPVQVEHADFDPRDERRLEAKVVATVREAVAEPVEGDAADVLVFLPGVGEIRRVQAGLADLAQQDIEVLPLHGELPLEAQARAVARGERRRVILATNVAETSLTVEGVSIVVDSGAVRRVRYDARRGLGLLELGTVSQASAVQRAGRAGRLRPGRAIRLWSEAEHRGLSAEDTPEIAEAPLARPLLELISFGVPDVRRFPWLDPPTSAATAAGLAELEALGAVASRPGGAEGSARHVLTSMGRTLLRLPVEPRLARMVLAAADYGVADAGAELAALLSERDLVPRGPEASRAMGRLPSAPTDLELRRDLMHGFAHWPPDLRPGRARKEAIRRAAVQILRILNLPQEDRGEGGFPGPETHEPLAMALLEAWPDRLCIRREEGANQARRAGGGSVTLAPESLVKEPRLFIALTIEDGTRAGVQGDLVRMAYGVREIWLERFGNRDGRGLVRHQTARFDPESGRVLGFEVRRFGSLVLEERPATPPTRAEAGEVLSRALIEADARTWRRIAKRLPDPLKGLRGRLSCFAQWHPEVDLSPLGEEHARELWTSLCPGCSSLQELGSRADDFRAMVEASLPRGLMQRMAQEAPASFRLPNGRERPLKYEAGRPPKLSARVQDLFGLHETPRVGGGKVTVLVEVLGPNHRPVQLTQDLPNFWRHTYSEVRRDLRGRYPKHSWPERPPGFEG